ncbi:terpenoid synthase [Pleurotus eryngii]|uniref:Terpenoid synthase n=1 Tax=Pleurotus eryngii TaxID=5323 RepID=A0A9P5ZUC1_PLEER|nr:terpenoid synthase [Pleurotus eryngii]
MVEPYDLGLQQECYEEAVKRGCIMTGKFSLLPHIPGGVVMAATAYKHLKSTETHLLIALYTAFLIFLDDTFHEDMDEVAEFNSRFITNKPNEIPNLNVFAELLRDLPKYFNTIVANIMVTSTLNLVTALSLEQEIGGMKVSPSAHSFPTFSRTMSGASECYALFAFPQTIPVSKYVQALPDMVTYINNGNDVLSFYKEECAKETCNRVSVLAQCNAITKYNVPQGLADEAASCHLRICDILSDDAESLNAYNQFAKGYIGFHTSSKRYKLNELLGN